MTFLEKLRTIERIDQLVRLSATGTPEQLAERLDISRSTLYTIIDCMKSMGAEIDYCRSRRSFFYLEDKRLSLGYVDKSRFVGGKVIHFWLRDLPSAKVSYFNSQSDKSWVIEL